MTKYFLLVFCLIACTSDYASEKVRMEALKIEEETLMKTLQIYREQFEETNTLHSTCKESMFWARHALWKLKCNGTTKMGVPIQFECNEDGCEWK